LITFFRNKNLYSFIALKRDLIWSTASLSARQGNLPLPDSIT